MSGSSGRSQRYMPIAKTTSWSTPEALFAHYCATHGFFDDPCPLEGHGGLDRPWGQKTFVNPPYGRGIERWIERAIAEAGRGKLVVMLLPARTGNPWWARVLEAAAEIHFITGRLRFGGSKINAPFDSVVAVFIRSNKRVVKTIGNFREGRR